MLMLVCEIVIPKTLKPEDIQAYQDKYYNYTIMNNCFLRTNILEANIDADLICISVFPTYNPYCDDIPQGIYLDIQVSNVADSIFRAQFQDYSYKDTKQLCFTCPVVDGKRYCDFIKQTESVRVFIRSLTIATQLTVGKILISHANLTECWNQTKSQVKWSAETIIFYMESTGICTSLRDVCDPTFFQYELVFHTIDEQKFSMTIPAVDADGKLLVQEVKDGSNFTVVITYNFSSLISGSYDKLEINANNNCGDITTARKSFVSLLQSYQ